MAVSSEVPLAAESVKSVLSAERAPRVNLQSVADEEFPPDLPVMYDWELQPASRHKLRQRMLGVLTVTVVALSIAVSLCLAYGLPKLVLISVVLAVAVLPVAFRLFRPVL